jgi:hypothetical protein
MPLSAPRDGASSKKGEVVSTPRSTRRRVSDQRKQIHLFDILNATPGALGSPDAGAKRLKLHDLAMVDE